jgi:hypothetical protein
MKLEELREIVDDRLGSDILSSNRQRKNAYARKLYCKLAYEGLRKTVINSDGNKIEAYLSLKDIADSLNVNRLKKLNHDAVYFHKKTFDKVDDNYKNLFNGLIDLYNLKAKKVFVKEENRKEIAPLLNKSQLSILNELKKLTDADVLEFRETRLKPYLKMLETRKKHIVIAEVKGALLVRPE